MFKRRPLQSKSEIWMRNIAMGFLIIYMTIFLIIPVIIVVAGSFHQWNPLNQTYNWIGLDNYIRMVFLSDVLAVHDQHRDLLRSRCHFPCLSGTCDRLRAQLQTDEAQDAVPHDLLHAYRDAAGGCCLCMEVSCTIPSSD